MPGSSFLRTSLLALAVLVVSATACLAETAHDAAHGASGIKEDLALWGFVAFLGFLLALKFLGWVPLTSGMRAREEAENRLLQDAERLRDETAALLRQQKGQMEALDEKIRATLAEAQRDADHTRRDIRAVADRESALARQRAELEIGRVRDQSLSELFATAADRITALAESRLREKLSPAVQQRLIDETVSDFGTRRI
jgi:F0F1-type ATP synthase membrane subunit b/b'